MRCLKQTSWLVIGTAFGLLATSQAWAGLGIQFPVIYNVTDLSALLDTQLGGQGITGDGLAINNASQITGQYTSSDGVYQDAFLYSTWDFHGPGAGWAGIF